MEQLKVSTRSNPNSVAGAMAGVVRHSGAVEVQVVGAGALNQAIKALAIARSYVAASGIDLVCVPSFADIVIEGERRTAIRLLIQDRVHPGGDIELDLEAIARSTEAVERALN
jgi:stage V sporulation protein S